MKKVLKIFMALLISILVFTANTYAAEITTNVEVQKNEKEYIVTFKINEITAETEGINVFSTILNYNKDDFEEVKKEDIINKNDWGSVTYNEETGKMLTFRGERVKDRNEEVLEIKLRQKENPKNGNTEIKFSETQASDGSLLLRADEMTVKISLEKNMIKDIIIYVLIGIAGLLVLRIILRNVIKRRRKVR